MRAAGSLVFIALLGCGRINYDPIPADLTDAGASSADGDLDVDPPGQDDAEAPDDAGPVICSTGAFSAATLVQIDGLDPDLSGPRLAADGTTLWVSRTAGPPFRDEDVWTLLRLPGAGARFDRPARAETVNSAAFDGSVFVSSDGLELLLGSDRVGGSGQRDIWFSRRPTLAADWPTPRALLAVNSASDEQNPSLSGDGLVLFFSSDREGTKGREDIYTSFRTSPTGTFSNPVRVTELSSGNKDGAPFVTADSLTIYFTSNRQGGRGGIDLWSARRASRTVPFSAPSPVANVNSFFHDDDPAISADGRELFFSSNRDGRSYRIYRASRCP